MAERPAVIRVSTHCELLLVPSRATSVARTEVRGQRAQPAP